MIVGQPGSGKSSVLARVALGLEREEIADGVAFHGAGSTHEEFLRSLAAWGGYEGEASSDSILDVIAELSPTSSGGLVVAYDGLDEAAGETHRREIANTLGELATLEEVRVVVATRPLSAGDRYAPGALLPTLGVRSPDSDALVDLDTDRYFDPVGFREHVAALLAQEGVERPLPPTAAWNRYRADPELCARLATVIAARADRNYLVAALAAVPLSKEAHAVDTDDAHFDAKSIPSGVGEALTKYLDQLPEGSRSRTRGVLTALAYARGNGIDDRLWLQFSNALGYSATPADLDELRQSGIADYLLERTTDVIGRVTRLFHQALADELLAVRDRLTDERLLLGDVIKGVAGWETAPQYLKQHAAQHAAAAGQLASLLDDTDYVIEADYTRLLPLLATDHAAQATPVGVVLRQVGRRASALPAGRRRTLLALTAAHLRFHQLGTRLAAADHDSNSFLVRWAHRLGSPHREITGHTGRVLAVAIGQLGDREVIVSASEDQTVRVWDAASGEPIGEPLTGHTGSVKAVAIGRLGDREVIVSASEDQTVRVWDAASGEPIGEPLTGHTDTVSAVAIGRVDNREVIVSGGWDETVRVWDAASGEPLGEPLTGHTDVVDAVAIGRVSDREVIVSGGWDRTLRVWDAASGESIGEPLTGHTARVLAVAIGRVSDREVIVSGGWDETVRVWDAASGGPRGEPLTGHTARVLAVAIGRLSDHEVIVSGGRDRSLRLWDAPSGEPLGEPLTGHTDGVEAVAIGRVGDRDVIVSGGRDKTVRVWDAARGEPLGEPVAGQTGHTGRVKTVAIGRVGDREVIISGGRDKTVRVWDAASGEPLGEPLTGHTDVVEAVAIGRVGDREVIVSGGWDKTVRVWDAASGEPLGEPLTGHTDGVEAVAIGRVGDREVIVSGGWDRTVRVWDAASGEPLGEPLTGHPGRVSAVAIGRAGDHEVIVSGGWDRTVRVWDAASGGPRGEPLTGHTSWVLAVAIGRVGDREVIVSGGRDKTLRVWDAASGEPLGEPLTGHTDVVEAVAVGRLGDREVIVSAGEDQMVRVWDAARSCTDIVDLLGTASAGALSQGGVLAVGVGTALCVFAGSPPS